MHVLYFRKVAQRAASKPHAPSHRQSDLAPAVSGMLQASSPPCLGPGHRQSPPELATLPSAGIACSLPHARLLPSPPTLLHCFPPHDSSKGKAQPLITYPHTVWLCYLAFLDPCPISQHDSSMPNCLKLLSTDFPRPDRYPSPLPCPTLVLLPTLELTDLPVLCTAAWPI